METTARSAAFFASHPVFTHEEYVAARGGRGRSQRTADSLLRQHVASGRILRVRRGIYASLPAGSPSGAAAVDPFLVATKLTPDATVAYHAALELRGKSYSVWHRFAVLSRHQVHRFEFGGNEFVGVQPPRALRELPDLGGGIVTESHSGGTVRVTSYERTLVDMLDRPDLGGGWEEAWRSLEMVEFFDLDAVVGYALKLGSRLTAARVGFFLDQHREALFVEDRHLAPLRSAGSSQPRYFDGRREAGRLVKPWNLIVPSRVIERSWAEVA